MTQASKIRTFLIDQVKLHPSDLVAFTAKHFGVTRTTVLRHVRALVDAGELIRTGTTKQTQYMQPNALEQTFTFKLDGDFEEYALYDQHVAPVIKPYLNANAKDIGEYALTEMLNNAKDHAASKTVTLSFSIQPKHINFVIQDKGVGIFKHLEQAIGYEDPRDAMLDLSKGKLTSDSQNHTGEGLFFTCRAVERFMLYANGFCYMRDNAVDDWSFFQTQTGIGTRIELILAREASLTLKGLFEQYTVEDTMAFEKTEVVVELAKEYGTRLISRSQGKRVVHRLDQFSQACLDFKNIQMIGQGFADQVFRIFKEQFPHVELTYKNANDDVDFMIQRSRLR